MEPLHDRAHQRTAEGCVGRDVERLVQLEMKRHGLSRAAAASVVRRELDEAMLDAIRESRVRDEHVQMLRLLFPGFSEAGARRRIVRAMDYWDCEPVDAVRCLASHLIDG